MTDQIHYSYTMIEGESCNSSRGRIPVLNLRLVTFLVELQIGIPVCRQTLQLQILPQDTRTVVTL